MGHLSLGVLIRSLYTLAAHLIDPPDATSCVRNNYNVVWSGLVSHINPAMACGADAHRSADRQRCDYTHCACVTHLACAQTSRVFCALCAAAAAESFMRIDAAINARSGGGGTARVEQDPSHLDAIPATRACITRARALVLFANSVLFVLAITHTYMI